MFREYIALCFGGECLGVFQVEEARKLELGIQVEKEIRSWGKNEADAMVKILNSDEYMDYKADSIMQRIKDEKISILCE